MFPIVDDFRLENEFLEFVKSSTLELRKLLQLEFGVLFIKIQICVNSVDSFYSVLGASLEVDVVVFAVSFDRSTHIELVGLVAKCT